MTRSRLVNLFKVFMLLLRILPPMLSGHVVREGLSRCTRGTPRLWRRRLTQDLSRVGARLLPLGPCGRESMAGRSGAHGPRRPAWGLCRRDRAVASHPLWTGPLLSCPSSTGPPGRPAARRRAAGCQLLAGPLHAAEAAGVCVASPALPAEAKAPRVTMQRNVREVRRLRAFVPHPERKSAQGCSMVLFPYVFFPGVKTRCTKQ